MKIFVKLVEAYHDGVSKEVDAIKLANYDSLTESKTIETDDPETMRKQIKEYCDEYAAANPEMSFTPCFLTLCNDGFSEKMVSAKSAHELDYIKNLPADRHKLRTNAITG